MKKNYYLSFVLILFALVSIVFPIINLCINIEPGTLSNLIKTQQFSSSLKNSIFVTTISTVISVLIAYLLAYSINRTNIKHKSVLTVLLTLPMLIPSISHGLGLINIFGVNGIIADINIMGIKGIIIGSVMYSFPVAFLMLSDAYSYIDNTLYDNAKVLGLNKFQTFSKVTMCYMKKPLISCIFAVFTLIFTDYGVPLAIGGNYSTLPAYLYKQVIGLLDFSKGTVIGLFLLIPAFVSFGFDLISKDYGNNDSISKKYIAEKSKIRDLLCNIFCYTIIIFISIILFSFVYLAFVKNYPNDMSFSLTHFEYLLNNGIGKYILISLIISLFTSLLGTIISYFSAYVTARSDSKIKWLVHILAIISLAIPGIVLGLSYVISFNGSFIYGTIIIIIMVNIVHFMSSPYLMAYNALSKINNNYEDVASTCGISKFKIIKDVIIPLSKITLLEMFSYFFVNSMITISAVAFLYNTKTMPLSILINRYEGSLMLEEAAIISLIILFFNLIIKLIVYLIKRVDHRRNYEINI